MKQYQWAANAQKLQRAIAKAKYKTEDEVKGIYITMGGLIIEESVKEQTDKAVEKIMTPASEVPKVEEPSYVGGIDFAPVEETKPKKKSTKKHA